MYFPPPPHLISSSCPSFPWPPARQDTEGKGNANMLACSAWLSLTPSSLPPRPSLLLYVILYQCYQLTAVEVLQYILIFFFSLLSVLSNSLLSSLPAPTLSTWQPIVFVSDRARANKEIAHDGIWGDIKKKPKVKATCVSLFVRQQRWGHSTNVSLDLCSVASLLPPWDRWVCNESWPDQMTRIMAGALKPNDIKLRGCTCFLKRLHYVKVVYTAC